MPDLTSPSAPPALDDVFDAIEEQHPYPQLENAFRRLATSPTQITNADFGLGDDYPFKIDYAFETRNFFSCATKDRIANLAVLQIVGSTEPTFLHEDAVPLSLTCQVGKAELLIYIPYSGVMGHMRLRPGSKPVSVKPGTVYAIVNTGAVPSVIFDFCQPPFIEGTETPLELEPNRAVVPGTGQVVPAPFWSSYLNGVPLPFREPSLAVRTYCLADFGRDFGRLV